MNFLIVSFSTKIVNLLEESLKSFGHNVDVERIPEQALKKILLWKTEIPYDWIILEAGGKDENFNLCRIIKFHRHSQKILVISPLSSVSAGEKAFDDGAEAYLEYPFSKEELLKSLHHASSRDYKAPVMVPLRLGDLTLNPASFEAFRQGKKLHLRKKEFQLLEFLLRNQNMVLNRHTILEYIWNYNTQALTNTLDVHMSSLRKKVDGDYSVKMIKTIYGAGYKLSDSAES